MPSVMKSKKSEIPVMMSGLRIGMLFTKLTTLRLRYLRSLMPMAATVPRSVDTVAATKAMIKVFFMASMSELFTPPEKSEVYNSVEKPVQLPSTLDSVKEKMAMITIGA